MVILTLTFMENLVCVCKNVRRYTEDGDTWNMEPLLNASSLSVGDKGVRCELTPPTPLSSKVLLHTLARVRTGKKW